MIGYAFASVEVCFLNSVLSAVNVFNFFAIVFEQFDLIDQDIGVFFGAFYVIWPRFLDLILWLIDYF